MNVNDVYGGKYHKAADLQGKTVRVTIAGASLQPLPTGQAKIALKFTKGDKLMLLNKTNAGVVAAVHGPSTDVWVGETIELYAGMTMFNGAPVPGFMVRIPSDAAGSVTPPKGKIEDLKDDIPW